MKEKLCEERRFWVLKAPKTQKLSGALPPGPPPGCCPWTVKTLCSLRSLRSTWTQAIFIQHPAATNPAHVHAIIIDIIVHTYNPCCYFVYKFSPSCELILFDHSPPPHHACIIPTNRPCHLLTLGCWTNHNSFSVIHFLLISWDLTSLFQY